MDNQTIRSDIQLASGPHTPSTVGWREKPLPAMPKESLDDQHLEYLREHPSAALPPSPLSPSSYGRPRAPTPSASDDHWPSSDSPSLTSAALTTLYTADSPVSDAHPSPTAFARPPKPAMPLPDPSQFPDPYPFRPPHHHLNSLPALSSAGSSSTRSSAYTSSGSALASGDYGHIHVASGDDEAVGVGITSDAVVQLLANDPHASSSARGLQSRAPVDQSRWSESYPTSARSRSSSVGNNSSGPVQENAAPKLQQKPSYDMGWQPVDERDEVGMSEEETDDDNPLDDDEEEEKEEERTSAVVVAEEGRGLIVHGDNVPIVQLQVPPGTTHLLIGSSSTPNAMPAFLTSTLPQICHSLLALDISANFLGALPPVLAVCENLEELNIASNPLRVLPVFLADLTNLRVIIADSTGISTLPDTLVDLDKIHTISVRKNKLHALPSWLCLLPALKTLCVDGNPFQGPWKALVEPLLANVPMSPMYPPSTPVFPLPSASIRDSSIEPETDNTDTDDLSDTGPPSADIDGRSFPPEDEEHTITPNRAAPVLGRSVTSPLPMNPPAPPPAHALTRTRTTPNRAHFEQSRASKISQPTGNQKESSIYTGDSRRPGDRELRKMKSAGDLRRGKTAPPPTHPDPPPPLRPGLPRYPISASSLNLLSTTSDSPERPGVAQRFATMGPSVVSGGSPSRPGTSGGRPQLTKSLWDSPSDAVDEASSSINSNRVSLAHGNDISPPSKTSIEDIQDGKYPVRTRSTKDGKEKGSRWGFLKKMSMGKMRTDSPSGPASGPGIPARPGARPHTSAGSSSSPRSLGTASAATPERSTKTPQIDLRFSTTGILDSLNPQLSSLSSSHDVERKPSGDMLTVLSSTPTSPKSSNLLIPPSLQPRTAKRRSFLPIEAPGALSLNIPIPESSPFVPGLTALNGGEESGQRVATPSSVVDSEQHLRREEERAREAYMRALRSVMAYLKDMNDLGLSQQSNPLSMYGAAADDVVNARSRRPTMVEGQREVSVALSGSAASSDSTGQLRSMESIAGLRSGSSAQTLSVATTDSTGSSEERKFKDDKGKRAMIVREIVVTERTYVKGLQELVDIYIKPACAPVSVLGGVGSNKDTVVPASERKLVFGGIEALFSFHKDSFLPALEIAAAPLMKSTEELQQADADGQLSLDVVKAVGSMFLKHAAFMRMYSSYINNFDSSVQRVKHWTAERNAQSPAAPVISPTSSTAQLVGLGLTMSSVSAPAVVADAGPAPNGVPNLSTSQRRRIKSYLKRCRMNPRHSQLNLEGYLLLPVQRIPRYRLLLEELLRSTPPVHEYMDDPLERALAEISSLANNMNEGKRESESRRKLVQWQSRIRGKFPSPLVQPHRRLIMDGPLLLTRVVRKAVVSFEAINAQGDASTVQVDCLAPELTPRQLIGILCNDLLVLCRDPSDGQDPNSSVDLWAVLRMQTLPQPASIVHGNALRLVDNKAILYFDAPSPSDALNWYRAINLHIPASKT
ncbi:putative rhoGEF domain containing protein [Lyophyllum shimeji]|uniref:RhoGEF domain containing protein n=1 Tax=Lyophyllum shimeji TaxID=47721 RepID=A0A9P3UJ12_LYOSH|nr:putative rhoGEF domain containing protein [Lyophyllum shimeji]